MAVAIVEEKIRSGRQFKEIVSSSGIERSSKAVIYIASSSIRIPSIVSVGHVKISHELAHNKAEKLIKTHCLPLKISLKRLSP